MHMLQTIRTKQLYGILYSAICKLYDIIYAPQFFHECEYYSKKEILLATCTCIYIAPAYLLFKYDEFYISKGAFSIPFTISYTVVCGVSQKGRK